MNILQIFKNKRFGEVRVATTDNNEPLFCLADICLILGLRANDVRKRLDDGVVSIHPIADTLGRVQQANFVNEDGLYDVILDSRKPEAKQFRKWVTSEVLPSIRKHGAYMTSTVIEKVLSDPDTLIQLATELKKERTAKELAEQKLHIQKPKVLFADAVEASKTSILIGELAKILKQNGIDIGQNRLFSWLRNNGYLISRKGTSYNMPTQRSMELGLFEIKETVINHSDGHVSVSKTPKIKGKGQTYFINRFLNA